MIQRDHAFFEMHFALSAQKSPSVPHAQGPPGAGGSSNCMLTATWHRKQRTALLVLTAQEWAQLGPSSPLKHTVLPHFRHPNIQPNI